MNAHRLLAVLLLPALMASTGPIASAQASPSAEVAPPCRQAEMPDQAERAMRVLSSGDAALRERLSDIGIAPQPPTARRGVLRLTSACARLRAELRKVIREADTPPDGLRHANWSFLELGAYYGVIVTPARTVRRGLRRTGAAPLYLFDRQRMTFVGRLAL